MNLAWIAAVLRPFDVLSQSAHMEGLDGITSIAALVSGELRFDAATEANNELKNSGNTDRAIQAASRALFRNQQEGAIRFLASELINSQTGDPARACALALITCASAAELDDYDTCFAVLEHQIDLVRRGRGADYRLLEAVLTQQNSLRQLDAGMPHTESSLHAARLLAVLDVSECSPFRIRSDASWSSSATLSEIVRAVYDSALSLLTPTLLSQSESTANSSPVWQDDLRTFTPDRLLEISASQHEIYQRYVAGLFADRYKGQTRTIVSASPPDLFTPVFQLELLAHRDVYRGRQELALLRLLQADSQIQRQDLDDVLRLLRHSGAAKDLNMALRTLREAGPLEALSRDARRILSNRSKPSKLRSVELDVVAAAAELLTPAEARLGLDLVVDLLNSGGPGDLPMHWQVQSIRMESAWRAAISLAHVAGQSNRIASVLLTAVGEVNRADEPLDHSLARAVINLQWAEVDPVITEQWQDWIAAPDTLFPITRDAVVSQIKPSLSFVLSDDPDLLEIGRALNSILNGAKMEGISFERGVQVIRERLREIRISAEAGRYELGGVSTGDIAVGLLLYAGRSELWPDVAEFITDSQVSRDDRAPAIERLARDADDLPESVREVFSRQSDELLRSGDKVFGDAIVPFPSALRLLGRFGCISEQESFGLASGLSGSSQVEKRREAGRTVALWTLKMSTPWLTSLAIQLSYDDDVQVRAHSSQALVRLMVVVGQFQQLAIQRLLELLRHDGLVIPLLALRRLKELEVPLPLEVSIAVRGLGENHPSIDVRLNAMSIVDRR